MVSRNNHLSDLVLEFCNVPTRWWGLRSVVSWTQLYLPSWHTGIGWRQRKAFHLWCVHHIPFVCCHSSWSKHIYGGSCNGGRVEKTQSQRLLILRPPFNLTPRFFRCIHKKEMISVNVLREAHFYQWAHQGLRSQQRSQPHQTCRCAHSWVGKGQACSIFCHSNMTSAQPSWRNYAEWLVQLHLRQQRPTSFSPMA